VNNNQLKSSKTPILLSSLNQIYCMYCRNCRKTVRRHGELHKPS